MCLKWWTRLCLNSCSCPQHSSRCERHMYRRLWLLVAANVNKIRLREIFNRVPFIQGYFYLTFQIFLVANQDFRPWITKGRNWVPLCNFRNRNFVVWNLLAWRFFFTVGGVSELSATFAIVYSGCLLRCVSSAGARCEYIQGGLWESF